MPGRLLLMLPKIKAKSLGSQEFKISSLGFQEISNFGMTEVIKLHRVSQTIIMSQTLHHAELNFMT